MDVRLRAEAAAADADPPFVAEDGRDQCVMNRREIEGDHPDPIVRPMWIGRAIQADTGHAIAVARAHTSSASLRAARRSIAVSSRARGSGGCDSANDVGTAGFLAVRQSSPMHFIGRHDIDRAASPVLRRASQEDVATANQHTRAEGRVHLVAGECHEIEMLRVAVRLYVDATVWRELCGIDEDGGADGMSFLARR